MGKRDGERGNDGEREKRELWHGKQDGAQMLLIWKLEENEDRKKQDLM
jgi:hypothetical protein